MLSPGESVIPAKQTQKYGALIQGIVADNIPGYQNSNINLTGLSNESFVDTVASLGKNAKSQSSIRNYLKKEFDRNIDIYTTEVRRSLSDFIQETTILTKKSIEERIQSLRESYVPGVVQKDQFGHVGVGQAAISALIRLDLSDNPLNLSAIFPKN